MSVGLLHHPEPLAVVRLGPGAPMPDWASSSTLLSVTATRSETSLVCAWHDAPKRATHEGPFAAFEVEGPLDFALTGVLAGLLTPLAEAQIPVFTLSTFDTDWVLVRSADEGRAVEVWQVAGHQVRPASADQPPRSGEQS